MEELLTNFLRDFVYNETNSTSIKINDLHEITVQYFYKECYVLTFSDKRLPREFYTYEIENNNNNIPMLTVNEYFLSRSTTQSVKKLVNNDSIKIKSDVSLIRKETPEMFYGVELNGWGIPSNYIKKDSQTTYIMDFEKSYELLIKTFQNFIKLVAEKIDYNNQYITIDGKPIF